MANLFDKVQTAISALKNETGGISELSGLEERMLKELCYIGDLDALKAQGTHFILPVGLIVSKYARLGKNCILYQNVTIGGKDFPNHAGNPANYPQIGDNVVIYPGAFVAGPITIGNNCIIGANTVVFGNVPDNCMVSGNPAKITPRG